MIPRQSGIGQVTQTGQPPLYVGFITDLTQQRALQKTVVENEQKYRSLMQNMPGVAFKYVNSILTTPCYLLAQVYWI